MSKLLLRDFGCNVRVCQPNASTVARKHYKRSSKTTVETDAWMSCLGLLLMNGKQWCCEANIHSFIVFHIHILGIKHMLTHECDKNNNFLQ